MSAHVSHEEGRRLAQALAGVRDERPFVLAIPKGGVLVGDALARELGAPLDVLLASKVFGRAGHAIAGIAEGGGMVFDDAAVAELRLAGDVVERLVADEHRRLLDRIERIRGGWPMPSVAGRTIVLVDDAVVTGLTMRAAIASLRERGARRIVVAIPLCAADASAVIADSAHDVVHLQTLPAAVAARVHGDDRSKLCPPLGDAEIHDLVVQELRDVGADPFGELALDGI